MDFVLEMLNFILRHDVIVLQRPNVRQIISFCDADGNGKIDFRACNVNAAHYCCFRLIVQLIFD